MAIKTQALARLQSISKVEACAIYQQAIAASSAKLGPIETFMDSIGITEGMRNGKPHLSQNKRTWEVSVENSGDEYDILCDKLGEPYDLRDRSVWVIKGKGIVSYSDAEAMVRVTALREKDIPNLLVDIVDGYDSDTRAKGWSISDKNKTIEYQCYEHTGRADARSLFNELLKHFGLKGWKVTFPAGHWGGND